MLPLRQAGLADAGSVGQHHQRQHAGHRVLLQGLAQVRQQSRHGHRQQARRARRQVAGPEILPAHRGERIGFDPTLLLGQRQRLLQAL
ncbi:hypothetical protein FQZ97_581080 [compost metagenome]